MKNKYKLLIILFLSIIIFSQSVFAVATTDSQGNAATNTGSSNALPYGATIVINEANVELYKVTKWASDGATRSRLIDSDGTTVLGTATYSGTTAEFSNVSMTQGATYYILNDDNGGAWIPRYDYTSVTFPVTGTNINFTKRAWGSPGSITEDTVAYHSVASITTNIPPAPPPANVSHANIEVSDLYDNSTLSGLTVYLGSQSNTTDGSGIAYFYNNTGLNYTVDGGSLYFNVSGTATENVTNNITTYGAFPDISVYNIEGSNILSFNLTSPLTSNTTSGGSAELLLPPNATTDVNVTANNYYELTSNITTTGKDVSNKNLTGMYQTILTINATNAFTGAVLSNWTGWIYNNETTYNTTFNTTGNTTVLNVLNGLHTIYIDVSGYSLSSSNYDYTNYTSNTETVTFSLYSQNSIYMNIFNADSGARVFENISITISGNASENTYYTTTGTYFAENLTDGNYTVKFDGDNFTQTTYLVTVADRSNQILNAYLTGGTDIVTFTILDDDTSQTIEGATIIQQRLINSTWTTVQSTSSDITGRSQFSYTIGVKYRFTITHPDYDAKVFELDPIIFTSYNIPLSKDTIISEEVGQFDVSLLYFPKFFENNANNTFTFTIGSVGGSLESYGYILSYPGGSQSGSGTSANGESFINGSFPITGATYGDYANFTYWYDSVYGDNKTYYSQFVIQGAANNNTLYNNKNEDYGLGTFEKILISIVVTIIFAGVLTLFGTPIAGLVGGLIAFSFFVFIGFISIWVALPTLVVATLLALKGGGQ